MLSLSNTSCSASELGEVVGVTAQHVRSLLRDKVLKRGKRGFRLGESVQAFLQYREAVIRKECNRTSDAYEKARTRRMRAQAAVEELRAGELQGRLLSSDDVDREVMNVLSNARSHLMALPSRVTHSLLPFVAAETGNANFQAIHQIVTADVRRSLSEASQLEANGISRQKDRAKRNGDAVD